MQLTQKKRQRTDLLTVAAVAALFVVMAALLYTGHLTRQVTNMLVPVAVYIVMAVSLNLVVGLLGELSLGHAGFMSVGLFSGCLVAIALHTTALPLGVRLPVSMLAGGLMAAVFGLLVGLPALRLRGDYLAIVTLACGEIIKNVFTNLNFTGGALGLVFAGEPVSLVSLMGFLVLIGVVVNNGIVFVDYTNQLRIGGLDRTEALVATGKTRMRPILMTTLTTVLAMVTMIFSNDMGSEMGKGMAIVVVGGLVYATLMTLFVVPVMYDIFFKKEPTNVDIGDEGMDDLPDDAAEYAASLGLTLKKVPAVPAAEDAFPDFPIEPRHNKEDDHAQ